MTPKRVLRVEVGTQPAALAFVSYGFVLFYFEFEFLRPHSRETDIPYWRAACAQALLPNSTTRSMLSCVMNGDLEPMRVWRSLTDF
jgi:hypothetical protein